VQPRLYIVAGAPGSGKSQAFPVVEFGVAFFNADDRAAALNGGSYHAIPPEIRQIVNRDFEAFIQDHIRREVSFAIETTLRSLITFDQIALANQHGFQVTMYYLGLADPEINLERIALRSEFGCHSAPREVLLAIHARSFDNLRTACERAFAGDLRLVLFDNSESMRPPIPVYEVGRGYRKSLSGALPEWVQRTITEVDFRKP
jgi:predicted ABC-type ATPase